MKNLPRNVAEDRIREFFSQKGEVTDAKLMRTKYYSANKIIVCVCVRFVVVVLVVLEGNELIVVGCLIK